MNWWTSAALLVVVLVVHVLVFGAIRRLCVERFRALATAYPALTPSPDALKRQCCSVSIDWFSFGMCCHIWADATHLHMRFMWIAQIFGAQAMSVPWDALQIMRRGRWTWIARVGKSFLSAPAWAMKLAEPDEA